MRATIFTGSRNWIDRTTVSRVFDKIQPDILIEGGADGLDTIAKWEALERHITIETFLPDWNLYGHAAGPIRNRDMLKRLLEFEKDGYEISVEAFPLRNSKGTKSMIRIAEQAGVTVRTYRHGKHSLMSRKVFLKNASVEARNDRSAV